MNEWILKVVILIIKNVERKKRVVLSKTSKDVLKLFECKRLKNLLPVFDVLWNKTLGFGIYTHTYIFLPNELYNAWLVKYAFITLFSWRKEDGSYSFKSFSKKFIY